MYCKLVRLYRRFPVRGGLGRPAPPPPRLRPRHVGVDGRGRRLLRHRLREARGYSGTDSMKPVTNILQERVYRESKAINLKFF